MGFLSLIDIDFVNFNLSPKKKVLITSAELDCVRKMVGYNLGACPVFINEAFKLHRRMEIVYASKESLESAGNKLAVTESKELLSRYLSEKLSDVLLHNIQEFGKYFELRYPSSKNGKRKISKARVCFKTNNKLHIHDLTRKTQSHFSLACHIEENTGFFQVSKTFGSYLNQNIPKVAQKPDTLAYRNPRFNYAKVKQYKLTPWQWYKVHIKKEEDLKWLNCWKTLSSRKGEEMEPTSDSCYKSTFIFPVSMRKPHFLAQSLCAQGDDDLDYLIRGAENRIFAYLCFDHPEVGFFIKRKDEFACSIISDSLFPYFAVFEMLTTQSGIYRKISAEEEVNV